jgi:hypothetical protein
MRYRLLVLSALGLLSACASAADDSKVGHLDFYDWIDVRRGEYASALDMGTEGRQRLALLTYQLKAEIDKRYDSIVGRADSEKDPVRRELAVSALGFSQRPEAVAHLEPRLADPDPTVRGTAAAAIGFLNPPNPPVDKIAALLLEPDMYDRQAALFALKILAKPGQNPEWGKRVMELARDDARYEIRNEAVLVLGSLKLEAAVDLLARTSLVDESVLVRRSAALALHSFGPKAEKAVPYLIERLKDPETGVVEAAHFALKGITQRGEADRQYSSWSDWYSEQSRVLEYVCPKDGTKGSAAGPCPTCGLLMEPRAIPGAEFECPVHPEVVSPKAGKCPKCQKDLIPRKKEPSK